MKFIRADGTILPLYQQLTELADEQLILGAGNGWEGLSDSQAVAVSQQLINSGTEPVLARGVLAIINPAGTLVAKQALPARRILPGENFDMSADYGGELPAGHYRAFVTYDLQNDKTVTSAAEFDVR